jgi:hypothetical protein
MKYVIGLYLALAVSTVAWAAAGTPIQYEVNGQPFEGARAYCIIQIGSFNRNAFRDSDSIRSK